MGGAISSRPLKSVSYAIWRGSPRRLLPGGGAAL